MSLCVCMCGRVEEGLCVYVRVWTCGAVRRNAQLPRRTAWVRAVRSDEQVRLAETGDTAH